MGRPKDIYTALHRCIQAEEQTEQLQTLTDFMAKVLGEKVEKVTVSQRLADSPCALVTSKFGYSANMERIMKTQVSDAALTSASPLLVAILLLS